MGLGIMHVSYPSTNLSMTANRLQGAVIQESTLLRPLLQAVSTITYFFPKYLTVKFLNLTLKEL